jgi:phosphate transport system permease protein
LIAERHVRGSLARRRPDFYPSLTLAAGLLAPLLVVVILLILAIQAIPSLQQFGLGFVLSSAWNPITDQFGALPFIYGTLVSSLLALALAIPVGVGTGIFLAEPRWRWIRNPVGTGVEMLAAIPSVVYGIWALYVMAPAVLTHIATPLQERLGFLPIFAGPALQTSMLAGALVLAVMILPTLAAVSRDVIAAVPGEMKEASTALGATWWEVTWKIVLPAARSGILGATVLALGRALGETIAITMVIGNRPQIVPSLLAPAYTLASVIANEFTEASGRLYSAALIELGLILVLLSLAVNLLALLLVRATIRGSREAP